MTHAELLLPACLIAGFLAVWAVLLWREAGEMAEAAALMAALSRLR